MLLLSDASATTKAISFGWPLNQVYNSVCRVVKKYGTVNSNTSIKENDTISKDRKIK